MACTIFIVFGRETLHSQAKMLFTQYKKRRRRSGFALSALLHVGLFCLLVFSPSEVAAGHRRLPRHKYSVIVLRLEDFRQRRVAVVEKVRPKGTPVLAAGKMPAPFEDRSAKQYPRTLENQGEAGADSAPQIRHLFALPPVPRQQPVKQTLVQPDVPPEIQLKQDIPLPTVLLWDLPPVRRKFVAPVAKPTPQRVTEMPLAPEVSAPNRELLTVDLKLAAMISNQNPRLVRPPGKTAPLNGASIQPVSDPPQIAPNGPADTGLMALISLPTIPVITGKTVAIPPANQVAASGSGGSESSGDNRSGESGPSGSAGNHGVGNAAANETDGQNAGRSRSRETLAPGSGFGGTAAGAASSTGAGLGAGGNSGDVSGRINLPIAGTTRFTLPKDGKFPVVVSGSSAAAPYSESVGTLSGKIVYSVFVNVGLRKKWILQYCLPKTEEQKTTVRGRAEPVAAPWPYVIVRPDDIGVANREYVLVHGMLTPDGRFDQLALIFPTQLEKKEVLMTSLEQWTFRPASRDGVPSEIEILLIIPSQSE